jgi:tetratricopeptide (TPR) repeat protein
MKCDNCGSDTNFEWATFCRNCNQPIRQDNKETPAQGPRPQELFSQPNSEPAEQASLSGDIDDMDIGVADPMDYVMGSGEKDQPPEIPPASEPATPEQVESELTLYRDKDLKLSVKNTDDDDKTVTFESLKSGYKVSAETNEKIEITSSFDERSDPPDMSEARSVEPPIRMAPPEIKEAAPASLARPEEADEPHVREIVEERVEPEKVEIPQHLSEVKYSKGVIYLNGKNLKVTGAIKVDPGDEILIKDKPFEVKREPKKNYGLYGGIGGATLIVILGLLYLSGFWASDLGQMAGIVISSADGRPLTGLSVRLVEPSKSSRTNEAGFFVFDHIPAGIYTIEFQSPYGTTIQDRVTILKNQTSTVALRDAPYASAQSSRREPEGGQPEKPRVAPDRTTSSSDKGFLKLTLSPNNSSVYLDGKPIGVGSNTYKVSSGTHGLQVRKSGYGEWSETVDIEADKTHSFKVTLREEERSSSPRKSLAELAFEKESEGNYKEALRLYDHALSKNPRDLNSILGKARCARAEGALDKAVTYYSQAAKLADDKNDTQTQIKALSSIIEIRPNTYTAYASRGDILYTLGQYERAIEDFSQVIQLDKRNLGAYYKLGNSYYKTGHFSDALSAFVAAEELNFADPKAQAYIAKTYLAMGDKRNTKKAYEKFKELASYSARLEFKKDPEWQKVLAALGETE